MLSISISKCSCRYHSIISLCRSYQKSFVQCISLVRKNKKNKGFYISVMNKLDQQYIDSTDNRYYSQHINHTNHTNHTNEISQTRSNDSSQINNLSSTPLEYVNFSNRHVKNQTSYAHKVSKMSSDTKNAITLHLEQLIKDGSFPQDIPFRDLKFIIQTYTVSKKQVYYLYQKLWEKKGNLNPELKQRIYDWYWNDYMKVRLLKEKADHLKKFAASHKLSRHQIYKQIAELQQPKPPIKEIKEEIKIAIFNEYKKFLNKYEDTNQSKNFNQYQIDNQIDNQINNRSEDRLGNQQNIWNTSLTQKPIPTNSMKPITTLIKFEKQVLNLSKQDWYTLCTKIYEDYQLLSRTIYKIIYHQINARSPITPFMKEKLKQWVQLHQKKPSHEEINLLHEEIKLPRDQIINFIQYWLDKSEKSEKLSKEKKQFMENFLFVIIQEGKSIEKNEIITHLSNETHLSRRQVSDWLRRELKKRKESNFQSDSFQSDNFNINNTK